MVFVRSRLPSPEGWEEDGQPGGFAGTVAILGMIAIGFVLLLCTVL